MEPVRGLSRAATIVDSLRAAAPGRVILLDAGDLLQEIRSPTVAHSAGLRSNTIVAAMNACTMTQPRSRNHEFNYGIPYLDSAIAQARFPFLSANTYRPGRLARVHAVANGSAQRIQGRDNRATPPRRRALGRENVRGRLTLGDIVPAVRQAVEEARSEGAQVVIVDIHSGLDEASSYDTVATRRRARTWRRGWRRRFRDRPAALRALAPGDEGEVHRKHSSHSAEELGDERIRRASASGTHADVGGQ